MQPTEVCLCVTAKDVYFFLPKIVTYCYYQIRVKSMLQLFHFSVLMVQNVALFPAHAYEGSDVCEIRCVNLL